MKFESLDDWLSWQETLNPAEIDLGLDRIEQVMSQAGMADHFACPLIIVAGTNGKGSTIAFIEAIATAAGRKVGCYTSPHIQRYNERIRIDGTEVSDADLCAAFQRIDDGRAEVPLTYFEFGTLAAIDLFHRAVSTGDADLIVMEIGLGGRLDAVNVMQPDVSIITGIALDHTDWLGETREAIAVEKAGVMRAGKTTIIGDWHPPDSLYETAGEVEAKTLTLNHDMFIAAGDDSWSLLSAGIEMHALPMPTLAGEHQLGNAACAISALLLLGEITLQQQAIAAGLQSATLPGRLQRETLDGGTELICDVAHNPQAICSLVTYCDQHPVAGDTVLVLAMLADKPVAEVVASLSSLTHRYFICGLEDVPRGMQVADLQAIVEPCDGDAKLVVCNSVEQACEQASRAAGADDRIIVTGSFYTVAAAMKAFGS